MISGVSLKDSSDIDKKNYHTKDSTDSTCLIVRLFPWLKNGMSSNIHNGTKQVKLNTAQTKVRPLFSKLWIKKQKCGVQ